MSDDVTRAAATPQGMEEATALLAELRRRVKEAAEEIDRLTIELVDRTRALDELESITDAVLGVTDTPVVLIGADRRVRAMTRGAAELLDVEGSPIGRPVSKVLPEDLLDTIGARLGSGNGGEATGAGPTGMPQVGAVTVRPLEAGDVLVVLQRT